MLLARAPHVGPAHVASRRAARLPRSSVAAMKRALVLVLALLVVGLAPSPAGADPRWVFYTQDTTRYTSPWFAGAAPDHDPVRLHRGAVLLPRPAAARDAARLPPRHRRRDAVRHPLFAARRRPGRLERRRSARRTAPTRAAAQPPAGWDLVIGHTPQGLRRSPATGSGRGHAVRPASDNGAPDGCHLHFEQRAVGGGLDTAMRPRACSTSAARVATRRTTLR